MRRPRLLRSHDGCELQCRISQEQIADHLLRMAMFMRMGLSGATLGPANNGHSRYGIHLEPESHHVLNTIDPGFWVTGESHNACRPPAECCIPSARGLYLSTKEIPSGVAVGHLRQRCFCYCSALWTILVRALSPRVARYGEEDRSASGLFGPRSSAGKDSIHWRVNKSERSKLCQRSWHRIARAGQR